MTQPQTANWQLREDMSLTIHEFDHEMNERGYVAHKIFSFIPRDKKSGKMPRVPLEQELQDIETRRNPNGEFNRSKAEWSDDSYDTQSHGLEAPIDDEVAARYDDIIDAETFEGNRIERAILRKFERENVTYITTAGNYAAGRVKYDLTSWATAGSATPYADVDTQREALFQELGEEPNALILDRSYFRKAMNTDDVLNRLKAQNFVDARPGVLNANAQHLALALDIPMVIIANSLYNVSAPGGARNLARIWPAGRAVLAKVAVTKDPSEICIGRSMVWSPFGAINGDRLGVISESYDEIRTMGTVQRRRTNWGRKVLHAEAARLLFIDGTATP